MSSAAWDDWIQDVNAQRRNKALLREPKVLGLRSSAIQVTPLHQPLGKGPTWLRAGETTTRQEQHWLSHLGFRVGNIQAALKGSHRVASTRSGPPQSVLCDMAALTERGARNAGKHLTGWHRSDPLQYKRLPWAGIPPGGQARNQPGCAAVGQWATRVSNRCRAHAGA